jgi:hypothetical protein
MGTKALFLNPVTYETEVVLEDFPRTVHELLVVPDVRAADGLDQVQRDATRNRGTCEPGRRNVDLRTIGNTKAGRDRQRLNLNRAILAGSKARSKSTWFVR